MVVVLIANTEAGNVGFEGISTAGYVLIRFAELTWARLPNPNLSDTRATEPGARSMQPTHCGRLRPAETENWQETLKLAEIVPPAGRPCSVDAPADSGARFISAVNLGFPHNAFLA